VRARIAYATEIVGEFFMKIVKGWRRIDKERGFLNEVTGQNLIVTKKQYGEHYVVFLFPKVKDEEEGRKISPEYPTEAKAEAFAMDWMSKHPKGIIPST
jgi:hypothetical protein